MYIEPSTTVRVLTNVPLDKTYEHTIYFSSTSAQQSYFTGKTKYTFNNLTFQRVRSGVIRVQAKSANLYDCNYLMFNNNEFVGSRWFYAFITGVDYVNNNTAEITYEMDVMQTWFFDHTPKMCFVEREHPVSDAIGSNLVPENVELGEYVYGNVQRTEYFDQSWYYLVASTVDESMADAIGETYGGVYSPVEMLCFTSETSLNSFFKKIANNGKQDAIIAVIPMPRFLADGGQWATQSIFKQISVPKSYSLGYTPKNNKLFTYPYNFLYVTNLNGNSAVYPYEYFSTSSCNFSFGGDVSCNPTFLCVPRNYKNVNDNYDEKLTLSGLPQCAYVTDAFKAWLAQNASNLAVSAISTVGGAAVAGATFAGGVGAAAGAIVGLGTVVGNLLAQVHKSSIQPPQAGGGQGSNAMVAFRQFDFLFCNKHIRPEFAEIIDEYFTKFGYATKQLKTPNRNSRPHWNYVKTVGCTITGNVPADDMYKICDIYDNGITFWKNGNEIGDYSLDNRPT